MTVHGSSATNPPAIVLRFYFSMVNVRLYFGFLLIVMSGKGGVGTPTLTTLFGDAKKRRKKHTAHKNITS